MIPPGWNVIEKFEMKKQNKEILEPFRWRVGGETAASVVCLSVVGGWVGRQLSNRVSGSAPAREQRRPVSLNFFARWRWEWKAIN